MLVPPLGLNPLILGHEFYNCDRGFRERHNHACSFQKHVCK